MATPLTVGSLNDEFDVRIRVAPACACRLVTLAQIVGG